MNQNLLLFSVLIFIAAFIGGIFPFFRKWSDELLHMFLSFGAGIFIGSVFLHLLPEAFQHGSIHTVAPSVLFGFMLVFFVEKFLFTRGNGSYDFNHMVISITALVGLSVHSFIAGLGLAVGSYIPKVGWIILISILAHKTTAAFSLTSLFRLAKMPFKKSLLLLTLFSLMTPAGALMFAPVINQDNTPILAPLMGLTTGTFLYVAVGELLPEVFHTKDKRWMKLILLIIGIMIMWVLGEFEHN